VIRIRVSPRGAVDCRATLIVPLSVSQTWGQIRDFDSFACSDLFHADIKIEGDQARAGAPLQIAHRFFVFRVQRLGRICYWKESIGYAFSDLSRAGRDKGFPHIFSYRLEATAKDACNLHIRVAGKWTATFVPRWVASIWMWWILNSIVQRVEIKLLVYRAWLNERSRHAKHRLLTEKPSPGKP
jgi:hypothetical protein